MADGENGGAESASEGRSFDAGKILTLLLAVLNLGVMGGGGFLIYKSTLGFERPSIREDVVMEELKKDRESEDNAEAILYTMDPFTVNLNGSPRRVIRVAVSLEMLDKEGFEEVVTLGPSARDAVVQILNGKEFKDVETIQGKLFLKDQIAVTLNSHLKSGVVKDVFFNDFLVQ
ncbi:MAG: flagellar basal body-associated FliL family protein [Bdellovibrionaceae bacterium]|nr:flagellar basal body-associated FliL family protein [Pseudobdellovibrionaceae bacterium]